MVFGVSQLERRSRNHGTRGMRSGENYNPGLGLSPSEPDIYTFISKRQVCMWCMGVRYRRRQRQHTCELEESAPGLPLLTTNK